jgi:dihydroflavonol-4-reductase
MVKALVTGGTGFVGSHIVRVLNDLGHEARVLHRVSSRMDALADLEFESALGDILDEESLREACAGCEWVFHVAAVADYWQAEQSRMMAANVEGTRRVLRAAREAGVRRVVFTSSAAAVGLPKKRLTFADETDIFNLNPQDFPYGYSKMKAEQVVQHAVRAHGQEVVTVNPVIVMGPGDLNMISGRFITEIARLGWLVPVPPGGVGVVDVRDVARWHVLAAEKGIPGERYILGSENYIYREWFGMVADTVGVRRPFIPVPGFTLGITAWVIDRLRSAGVQLPIDADQTRLGARRLYFNYDKTHDAFGPPQVDMAQSLRDTYAWYVEHGYL